jgi:cob(I)alamin adenosyltransferase
MIKIYTKTGDDGTTGLFGGRRVQKHSARIEAYGTVDELNSILGIALTHRMDKKLHSLLTHISSLLFTVGSDLATPIDTLVKYHIPRVQTEHITFLENNIDIFQADLPELRNFILPGGCAAAAHLHHARTVCRRAERAVTALATEEAINETVLRFLNRLSDFLFVAARIANFHEGVDDIPWEPDAVEGQK